MRRPSGSNADEWHLFLSYYLDNRATTAGDGLAFIAVQIAEAMEGYAAYKARDGSKCWRCGEPLHQGHFCGGAP